MGKRSKFDICNTLIQPRHGSNPDVIIQNIVRWISVVQTLRHQISTLKEGLGENLTRIFIQCTDHTTIGRIITLRASDMSTLNYKGGNASPAIKRVIYICNVHSHLHKGNTSNVDKRLNFKRCVLMI